MNKDISLINGHKLKHIDGDLWQFVVAEEWMPIQIIHSDKSHDIISLDAPDMFMPLMTGCSVKSYKIQRMFEKNGNYMVILKNTMKEYPQDIEQDDIIYIVDLDKYTFESFKVKKVEYVESIFHTDGAEWQWYNFYAYPDNKRQMITIGKNSKGTLNSKEGVKSFDSYMFTNESYARKFLYDKIQDKINELRNIQKELMIK